MLARSLSPKAFGTNHPAGAGLSKSQCPSVNQATLLEAAAPPWALLVALHKSELDGAIVVHDGCLDRTRGEMFDLVDRHMQ